jgi:hypothetical protein
MEYRAQTYLGALQLLAVMAGSLFLRIAVKTMDEMLAQPVFYDPLRVQRLLGYYGWLLAAVPVAWVVLTIRGDRSDRWWASKPLTIGSGVALLLGFAGLFGWAGVTTCGIFY